MKMTEQMEKYPKKEAILLVLLLILIIIIRLPTTSFPGTPDSYSFQGQSISIIKEGYANWILHPVSLVGLYPLSYPSAYMYFLSYFSLITGMTMTQTVQITAIIFGIIGTFGIFVFAKEYGSFLFAYSSALIFSISVYFINFTTAGNASARIFLLMLLPTFMWLLLKLYNSKNKIRYALFSIMLYILMAMAHRLVQLVFIVLVAYILTILYFKIPEKWPQFKKTKFYKFYFEKRYALSKRNVLFDITLALFIIGVYMFIRHKIIVLALYLVIFIYFIFHEYKKYSVRLYENVKSYWRIILEVFLLGFIVIMSKVLDLLIRGRLGINIERQVEKYAVYTGSLAGWIKIAEIMVILTVILLVILGLSIFVYSLSKKFKYKQITFLMNDLQKKAITIVKTKIHLCISVLLLIIFSVLFISQFFGHSLYSLSVEDYYEGELFEGTSPLTMFLNMVINYTTGTTIFFPIVALGVVILIFKRDRNFSETFLLLIMLALSSILLDKRYARLFVIPFFSLLTGLALYKIIVWSDRIRFKKIVFASFVSLLILIILFSSIFANREFFFEKEKIQMQKQESLSLQRYTAAMFLKNLDLKKAIIGDTDLSIIEGLSEAKTVPLSYNQLLDLKAKTMTFKEIVNSILRGIQIKSIWVVEDWINSGEYYDGRHVWQILNMPFTSNLNRKLLQDYQIGYFIRDEEVPEEILFTSLKPIKNKIYDNPSTSIWDINKGQV